MTLQALRWLLVLGALALLVARSDNRKLVMSASLCGVGLTPLTAGLLFVMGGPLFILLCCWVVIGHLVFGLSRRARVLRDRLWP